MEKIHTIVTHPRPHLDELVGIVLLRICGTTRYEGIEDAEIKFCSADTTPEGKSWKQLQKEGILLIGIGGGIFDEHPTLDKERKEGECAATLVAKHLNILDEPWLAKLLKYVTANDTKGGTSPFDLAAMINRYNKQWFDKDPQKAIEWAVLQIEAYLTEQMEFFITTKDEFEQVATICNTSHNGKNIIMVYGISDNDQFGAYARSQFGAHADVVVQKNSKGNVIITTKKTSGINLDNVVRNIRLLEMRKRNFICSNIWDVSLTADGKCEKAEEWFYQKQAGQLLNGSRSASSIAPTKISFEKIVTTVKDSLSYIRHSNNSSSIKRAS